MARKKDKELGLYTLKETCELLKVHPQTLRQWDRKGILKAVRIGRRKDRRYRMDQLKTGEFYFFAKSARSGALDDLPSAKQAFQF